MARKKILLIASLTLNAVFVIGCFLTIQRFGGFKFFVLRLAQVPNGIDFHNRTSHFETLPDIEGEIFFLGNSLTEQANWNELFNSKCLNRAISGDDTQRLLQRMQDIVDRKPAKIFILIGINDLSRNVPDNELLRNYENILKKIQADSPHTLVYLQSILPVNNTLYNHRKDNGHIQKINAAIEALAHQFQFTYINLFDRFTDDHGNLDALYTIDGAHLNGQGYLHWKEILKSYVQ